MFVCSCPKLLHALPACKGFVRLIDRLLAIARQLRYKQVMAAAKHGLSSQRSYQIGSVDVRGNARHAYCDSSMTPMGWSEERGGGRGGGGGGVCMETFKCETSST